MAYKKSVTEEIVNFRFPPLVVKARDDEIRFRASSGGAVTALLKYLFDSGNIDQTVNYTFSATDLYKPELINRFADYKITGSIYHETKLISFIRTHLDRIKTKIAITCLPCEVLPIRHLLAKREIRPFFIGLCCSGQLTKEATLFSAEKIENKKRRSHQFTIPG